MVWPRYVSEWARAKQRLLNGCKEVREVAVKKLVTPVLIFILLVILAACQLAPTPVPLPPSPTPTVTLTPIPPTPAATPTITPTPLLNSPNGPPLRSIHMFTTKDGWGLLDDALLVTHDGGVTWASVPLPNSSVDLSTGYEFFDANVAVLLVPAPDGKTGLFLSTKNGGGTWQVTPVPFAHGRIDFIDAIVGFVYDVSGGNSEKIAIYQSLDAGQTWGQVYDQTAAASVAKLPETGAKNQISFIDPSQGWIGFSSTKRGEILLYQSVDSGRNWYEKDLPLPENSDEYDVVVSAPFFIQGNYGNGFIPVDFYLPETGASNRIFYFTHDLGATWTPGGAVPDGGAYTFIDANTGWAWGKRGLYGTTDGAQTWLLLPVAFGRSEHATCINFIDSKNGWLITVGQGSRVRLYRTTDGGYTWTNTIP
jgi:photosystem II stability/assembly factor-like uncharacterized protein